jgi:hypothetical protein
LMAHRVATYGASRKIGGPVPESDVRSIPAAAAEARSVVEERSQSIADEALGDSSSPTTRETTRWGSPVSTPRSTSAPRRRANGSTPSFLNGGRGRSSGSLTTALKRVANGTNSRLIPLGLVDPFLVFLRTKTHGCATSGNRFERRQGRALDWLYTQYEPKPAGRRTGPRAGSGTRQG